MRRLADHPEIAVPIAMVIAFLLFSPIWWNLSNDKICPLTEALFSVCR